MELIIAIFALAACTIFCGIGSAIGLYKTGSAASAVIGEDPKKFSKVLVLAVLPATQGIYGFVITIIGTAKIAAVAAGTASGMALLGAILPITVVGCISAIFQGKTSLKSAHFYMIGLVSRFFYKRFFHSVFCRYKEYF